MVKSFFSGKLPQGAGKRGARRARYLQGQMEEWVVRVAAVAAAGALDLAPKIPAKDAVHKGRLVEAWEWEAVPPSGHVGVNARCPELPVVHGVEEVDEELVGILLPSRPELVAPMVHPARAEGGEGLYDRARRQRCRTAWLLLLAAVHLLE